MNVVKKILIGLGMLAFLAASVAPAFAHGGRTSQRTPSPSSSPEVESESSTSPEAEGEVEKKVEEVRRQARERKAEAEKKVTAKKDEARVKRCEERQERLKQKYEATGERSADLIARIDRRFQRAQGFAEEKNITLSNAAELEADVATKKAAAQAAADAIKTTAGEFDCKDDDAKVQAELIRADVVAFKEAVKAYRASVKAYFGAVIQAFAASQTTSPTAEPSESPTTTVTPGGSV